MGEEGGSRDQADASGPEDVLREVLARLGEPTSGQPDDGGAASPSLEERLRQLYGDHPEPAITLASRPERGADPPSDQLLQRLSKPRTAAARYEDLGELAHGGMGVIYKVWDGDLRRTLAMKVALDADAGLREGGAGRWGGKGHSQALHRFLEEAQVTGQLDHPGIVPVHELGLDAGGRVFFTMRLVRGRDLSEILPLIRKGQEGWSQTRALGVLLKVCEALSYAHAKGVIHRDLKPSNIMVGRFGEVYVMDWGLAKVLGHEDSRDLRPAPPLTQTTFVQTVGKEQRECDPDAPLLTMDGTVVGTPAYMAPEQARGEVDRVEARSDVYSLGALLYTLLTGQMPYVQRGTRVSAHVVLSWVIEGPPRPVSELAPEVPAELAAICEMAMEREPDRRYGSAAELADDLHAYLDGRVVAAYETGALAEFRKWVARNRGTAVLSAVLILALAVGAIVSSALFVDARRKGHELTLALGSRDTVRLMELEREARELLPLRPELAPLYESWIERADELVERLPLHRHERDVLRATAGRQPDLERLDVSSTGAARWVFARIEDQRRHDEFDSLVRSLEELADPRTGLIAGVSPAHGLGVARRLELLRRIDARMADPDVVALWDDAIASIADVARAPEYGGLRLRVVWGLVPLGRDQESGLWEFADLQTGVAPRRDPLSQRLRVDEDSGVVFVLLPAGSFTMGAQSVNPDGKNYDPTPTPDHIAGLLSESPPHPVELDAFFISKYELTQAQWMRCLGMNPSRYGPETKVLDYQHDLSHPVENVDWFACSSLLANLGQTLPTEAQWEYAARGGRSLPWSCGLQRECLIDAANLQDGALVRAGGEDDIDWPELDDGYAWHAPVGSFASNPFGLHDVHGNVFEWCGDTYGSYRVFRGCREGDGARLVEGTHLNHPIRGGGFLSYAFRLRSSARIAKDPEFHSEDIGLRPVRALRSP